MPAYLSLNNFTEQGIRTVKDTVKRAEAVRQQAAAMGGRVIGIWWLMGQYDSMIIFEAPDDATAMQALAASGMQGNIRSSTMRAFSEEEMAKIVAGLP
jgi:uncharacterized protein with GYD domain